MNDWIVYILRCHDGTYYTGITNDMDKRLSAHNAAKGAKYTKPRLPVTLAYTEPAPDRSTATKRELAIKKLNRAKKEALVQSA